MMRGSSVVLVIFLMISVNLQASSPVQEAMGQTSLSRYSSAQVIYYNPALSSCIDNRTFSLSYRRLYNLSELDQIWLSSSYRFKHLTTAISFSNFGETDILTENYLAFAMAYSFYDNRFQIGANLIYRWIDFGLDNYDNLNRIDFDIGAAGLYKGIVFHAAVYDITQSRYTDNDPKTEIGYRCGIGIQSLRDFTVNFELSGRKDDPTRFHFGQEFVLQKYLVLRFGIVTEPTLPSVGFGIVYDSFRLDYAINRHSRLDESHSLGISYSF